MDFEIVWQTRESEEIRFADKVSKDFDFGDYRISDRDFHELIIRVGVGSDAFGQDEIQGFGYFHSPGGLVPRVLERLRRTRHRAS